MAAALRAHRLELTLFVASTLAALVVLRLVDTQIYTEPWTIDPWLYTALMTNFDFTYQWFNVTYYGSRLPLIVPGLFLNAFLSPEHAYVVYHIAFFLAGGVFLYLLVRSLFGMRVALFVYPAILTNAIYVDTHTWDYFDGVVITYLAAGLYFLASSIGTASRVRPALAGFFLAAAAATNLFALLLALGAVTAYLYGRASIDRPVFLRRVVLDAVWFSLGAAVLLVSCGVFAERQGARFLFFMPSVDALRAIDLESYKLPTYDWMRQEPRLLVPLFLGAVAIVAWPRRGSRDPGLVGLAVTAAGVAIFLVLVLWEFGRSGTFLQIAYYFSTLYPFLFVALATAVYALLGRPASGSALPPAALATLGLAAGATPLFVIYASDRTDTWGERGSVITLILMGCALTAAVLLRLATVRRLSFVLAPLAAVLAVTSVSYASAANATTYADFETRNSALAHADDTFALGAQLVAFMQGNELQDSLPAFWYDQSADVELMSLQSLYYYHFTFLNLKLPVVDEEFRVRVETRQPKHIVLLCTEPTCRRGGDAMRRAGYRVSRVAAERLRSGARSVWVEAYALQGARPS